MFEKSSLDIYLFDDLILIKNKNGKEKSFPRCGITDVELFVMEMAKKGELSDLV
ncbi:hypothetical protein AAA799E16_01921 [Marine Group I thaumarchaeote SCGC AAA799-E16]|uniref:Uncharacterized protein n=5 Tax=Marine Group I TaxID=905826 RepID=A0A087S1F5_9ARCH|nr:hypothetical protein AAA799N04_01022 [Marine Group I thaumarchaeote SCGC AAA799-N04]KER05439.1 hypothetical protein AAA799E16_01921 [Marine Group I thaumarchaeote SCGC AAA799-E16]KFM15583.1 hypothetical protein AAA799D11_01188 [Marine Group I thaumarchaeote SCGC AAA799-D11]KFM16783.1 hypothetical protein SCCGRSA3_02100 [Marine Group I thaumarchaeote SCGC RSA3]KFM19559.1 hypothetical protein AAA799P11_00548 [Marine Group I thaumarchaeote SCGC AAA799-P11]